jgi:hypothetical protein
MGPDVLAFFGLSKARGSYEVDAPVRSNGA